ncbi:hypothetical protein [Streptomyces sp. NPDC048172]|uniref:hypothetical protein n=1 Tax=Streptomyces sp. NPDC048172 TaxID=3365505 RepID=UPI00371CA0AF
MSDREWCARCHRMTGDPVMIGAVESGSGPGAIVYACPSCALEYAANWFAPDWLREDLAARGMEAGGLRGA